MARTSTNTIITTNKYMSLTQEDLRKKRYKKALKRKGITKLSGQKKLIRSLQKAKNKKTTSN